MNGGKRSESEYGGESAGNPMDPGKVPSQEELDEDRKNNPDTSTQVGGADRDAGGGGGDGAGGG